ncbi:hypothetical protein [Desulfuromonas sp. DDH964]|uniref:hypothetical protein n=1 Tax=Desulfuromonas sp. DDH964 TaxID=1823759 RepID=UPI0012F8DC89|nr:hypothetical protein [Desulfuromonas sp. DDH964]
MEDDQKTVDAHHFTQQYSLLWSKKGLINGGRGGKYDLALGGELNYLDSAINGQDISLDSLKVLYNGDLLLAPGGLPFRMHLFSNDLHQSQFLNDAVAPLNNRFLLQPAIATDLLNGQHYVSGASLLLGIRNGSYLGRYRDTLSQLPRILLDYRESYVRDTNALTPSHYRDRQLAFVSLNKKDNWFHYRFKDFVDYEDHENDYQTKTWILGTVDETMRRRWINMVNWIKISADGSYEVNSQNRRTQYNDKRYDLNLFTVANRSAWSVSNFTTFHRISNGSRVERVLDVPVFANGRLARDANWRLKLIGHKKQQDLFDSTSRGLQDDDLYLDAQLEAYRSRPYILTPRLEVETRDQDFTSGQAARATLEVASNSKYSPKVAWFGSLSTAYFAGQDNSALAAKEELSAWEQVAVGEVDVKVSRKLRTSLLQKFIYFTGDAGANMTNQVVPQASGNLVGTNDSRTDVSGTTYRSTSTARMDYIGGRLRNALEATYDFLHRNDQDLDQWLFRHDLSYSGRNFRARMTNTLTLGVELAQQGAASVDSNFAFQGNADRAWQHSTDLQYSPGRSWETTLRADYYWRDLPQGASQSLSLRQTALYNWYTVNGLVRKIAELEERIESDWIDVPLQGSSRRNEYGLRFNYYPIHRILLGARARYIDYDLNYSGALISGLVAQFNYPKLQVALSYDYGTSGNVDEQRWEVKVRKIF